MKNLKLLSFAFACVALLGLYPGSSDASMRLEVKQLLKVEQDEACLRILSVVGSEGISLQERLIAFVSEKKSSAMQSEHSDLYKGVEGLMQGKTVEFQFHSKDQVRELISIIDYSNQKLLQFINTKKAEIEFLSELIRVQMSNPVSDLNELKKIVNSTLENDISASNQALMQSWLEQESAHPGTIWMVSAKKNPGSQEVLPNEKFVDTLSVLQFGVVSMQTFHVDKFVFGAEIKSIFNAKPIHLNDQLDSTQIEVARLNVVYSSFRDLLNELRRQL